MYSGNNFTSIFVASTQENINITDKFQNITGDDLLARLKMPDAGRKDGSHYIRTTLKTNGDLVFSRNDINTDSIASILILDCDKRFYRSTGEEMEGSPSPEKINLILRSHNIAHVLYGSYSHYEGTKGNRYRVVLPTTRPYAREELTPTLETIIALINSSLDNELLCDAKENHAWSQGWYYPRKPANSTIDNLFFEFLDGQPLEIAKACEIPPQDKMKKERKNDFHNGEISPINAFNSQYDIANLLHQYKYTRVYYRKNFEKWLSQDSSSRCAGITLKDQKVFSHHTSDVLNDGYWHDAFDVMRLCENLSENEAIIKAANITYAPDGKTVDQHNKESFANGNSASGNEKPIVISFEQYKPFNSELLPADPVPYEALPESMADFIKEYSVIRGCPADYILGSLLARLGCVFAGKIKLALTRNTSWICSPNFFWMMIGNPSSGKSNAFSLTDKPIKIIEELAREQYKKDFRGYNEKFELLERKLNAAYKGLEQECKKKSRDDNAVIKFENSINTLKKQIYDLEESKPKLKRYTIQKLTIEKLILILEDNPDGVMLELDELSGMFVRLSKDEHGDERSLFLSAYNGNIHYSYDTVKRGTVLIPNLLLSILGGTQPAKLKRFLSEAKSGHQDDGLLQRFQGVVFPDRQLMLPLDKKGDDLLIKACSAIFQNLNNIAGDLIFQFDDSAQAIFDEWREEATKEAYNLSYPLDAHVGKSYEFVAALSLYLCLYDNHGQLSSNNLISQRYILSAIKLGKYFLSHAKKMYGLVYQEDMPARSLSKKLAKLCSSSQSPNHYNQKLKLYSFTRSQIRVKDWSDLTTKEQRIEAIEALIKMGHISQQLKGMYYINPRHLQE